MTPDILVEEMVFKASNGSEPKMLGGAFRAATSQDDKGKCDSVGHPPARCSFPVAARLASLMFESWNRLLRWLGEVATLCAGDS